MSIEEKLNRTSQLLEKLLLQLELRNFNTIEKKQNIIDHPTTKLMEQFIESIKSLKWLNNQIDKISRNQLPYFMKFTEVKKITGFSRSTLDRQEKSGNFPSRKKLGENSIGWLSTDVYEWVSNREILFNKEQ